MISYKLKIINQTCYFGRTTWTLIPFTGYVGPRFLSQVKSAFCKYLLVYFYYFHFYLLCLTGIHANKRVIEINLRPYSISTDQFKVTVLMDGCCGVPNTFPTLKQTPEPIFDFADHFALCFCFKLVFQSFSVKNFGGDSK